MLAVASLKIPKTPCSANLVQQDITSAESSSFCMKTFRASLTNLTALLPQSYGISCYVIRRVLAPPPQTAHTELCAYDFAHSPFLWRQPRLSNVTCAWRWRLCGINPATRIAALMKLSLSVDYEILRLVHQRVYKSTLTDPIGKPGDPRQILTHYLLTVQFHINLPPKATYSNRALPANFHIHVSSRNACYMFYSCHQIFNAIALATPVDTCNLWSYSVFYPLLRSVQLQPVSVF